MMADSGRSSEWFWGGEEPEWLVILTLLIALTLGALLMGIVTTRMTAATVGGLSWRYPADWVRAEGDATQFSAGRLGSATRMNVRVLRELDPAAPVRLDDVVAQHGFDQAEARTLYRVLSTERVTLGGQAAVALHYAYATVAGGAATGAVPLVMEGVDYIVPHGARIYVLSLETEADEKDASQATLQRIVRSVRFE